MNRQQMMDFGERMVRAHDNDERARHLVGLASDATLSRLGLARQPSTLATVLSYGGAIAIGALVGAGAALIFAPTTGEELQAKLRTQARRFSREVKSATDRVEAMSDTRDHEHETHDAHA